jgi:hypothetical protein
MQLSVTAFFKRATTHGNHAAHMTCEIAEVVE